MKILLVIPPYVLGEDNEAVMPHKAMLPVGSLIIAGQLRERGHQVEVLDLVFEETWWQMLPKFVPDILLLSCHTVRNILCCAAVLHQLRVIWGRKPHTVIGGNACLHLGVDDFRKFGVETDAVVRGFGHAQNVLKAIEAKETGDINPKDVSGDIPIPALYLLPADVHQKYRQASEGKHPMYGFGAGCYYFRQCGETYCDADMDSPWLPRSSDLVAQELRLAKQLGYTKIWCVDNLLFTNLDSTLKFNRLCAQMDLEWSGMTRVELVCKLPKGFLQKLTHLKEVAMGVETASAGLLQNISRTTQHTKVLQAFRLINEAGIRSNAFVMLDLPGMNDEDFFSLHRFLLEIQTSTISWSFYNPPARQITAARIKPADMGFYRWPLGFSAASAQRVVQWAMLLSGRWWDGWIPKLADPFFETETEFGVNFLEGRIAQGKNARDAAGDIWRAWQKGRRK